MVGMWGARVHSGCLRLPMNRQAFGELIQTSEESKDTNHRLGLMVPQAPASFVCVTPAPAEGPGPSFHLGTLRPEREGSGHARGDTAIGMEVTRGRGSWPRVAARYIRTTVSPQ